MELWLASNSNENKFTNFLNLVGFEFEKVEMLSLRNSKTDDFLDLFLSRAKSLKEIRLTDCEDSDLKKVADEFSCLRKLSFNASEVSVTTLDYLFKKCKIGNLGLNEPSIKHLRYLAANSNVNKLKGLDYCSPNSEFSEEAREEEQLLCRFVRNSGENLEELSLYTSKHLSEQICCTIAENCPNFDSFTFKCFKDNQPMTLRMLEMIAEKCSKFPRKLEIYVNAELLCTSQEAINFMEKFYSRVEELSLWSQESRSMEVLMDTNFLDPQKLRKLEFGFFDIPLKPFFESISQMDKLTSLKLVCMDYDKEVEEELELKSKSLKKLNLGISNKPGCIRVICDNLTQFSSRDDIVMKTNKILESIRVLEDPSNILSQSRVQEFSFSRSLNFEQLQK